MKFFLYLLVLVIAIFFPSCKQSPLCFRTGADYFPLKLGNTMHYSITPANKTISVRVTDSAKVIGDRESFVMERNGKPEYWWKNEKGAEKLYLHIINIEGKEDTLTMWWIPWLKFPFSIDNSWKYTFTTSKVLMGDTVTLEVSIDAKVIGLEADEYKIKVNFLEKKSSEKLGSYSNDKIYYEWYKPDLGMTKRRFGDTIEVLTEFVSGEDTLLNMR